MIHPLHRLKKNYRFIGTKQKPPLLHKARGVPKDVSPACKNHFPFSPGAGDGTQDLGSARRVLYPSTTGLYALG